MASLQSNGLESGQDLSKQSSTITSTLEKAPTNHTEASDEAHLDGIERYYKWQYQRAMTLFEDKNTRQCNEAEYETIAKELLAKPDISTFIRAGMHYILAFSDVGFFSHAKKAVEYYQEIADQEGPGQDIRDAMLADAQNILHVARKVMEEQALESEDEYSSVEEGMD